MTVDKLIEEIIREHLPVLFLEVKNESHMHRGPAIDSHYKVTIVSEAFNNHKLIERHRMINERLAELIGSPIHALSLHTYTQNEWKKMTQAPDSPPCIKK